MAYTNAEIITGVLKWAKNIADSDKYGYKTWTSDANTHKCPLCNPGSGNGWNCIGFVTAAYYHGGGLRLNFKCNCGGFGDNAWLSKEPTAKQWNKHNGPGWIRVTSKKTKLKNVDLHPGDVLLLYNGSACYHMAMVYSVSSKGVIKVADSGSYSDKKKQIAIRTYSGTQMVHVYRYTGTGNSKSKKPYTNSSIKVAGTKTNGAPGLQKIRKSTCAKDVREGAVAWGKAIAKDNRFHYGGPTGTSYNGHFNGCYFCGTNKRTKPKGMTDRLYSYCCNPFVNACFAHGGGDKGALKLCKKGTSRDFGTSTSNGYEWATKHTNDWKRLHPNSIKDLIPGDVMCSSHHVKLYIGDKKVVHASGGDDNKRNSKKWNNSIRISSCTSIGGYRCYRYIGKGGGWMTMPTGSGGIFSSDSDSSSTTFVDNGQGIVLEDEIASLYSSQNFSYLTGETQEDENSTKFKTELYKSLVEGLNKADSDIAITGAVYEEPANISGLSLPEVDYIANKPSIMKTANKGSLLTFPTYVEAPTVVLDFNGVKIGGYKNSGDRYPNYITGMIIDKINGRINNYTITLSYQVRPGEDPNFIDKLISRTGYRNPLKILYGDSMYDGGYFRDEEAVIIDARHNEDIGSYRITYTIKAISSIGITPTAYSSFSAKTEKPSTAIYDLLYNSGQASRTLLTMFPGMQNRTVVASAGLIPTTDKVINLSSMTNVSPLTYLSYVTACMLNASGQKSSYFLTYSDTTNNSLGGAYFKITEVTKSGNTSNANASVYSIDIGYPTDNNVLGFQINTNEYWPLVYENAGSLSTWQYGIDDNGQITAQQVNLLERSDKFGKENVINSQWWKQVTEYPISAKLTLRGLIAPAILMSYIDVNAYFYGQKDMASGLYVVTAQKDSISGSGYTTELTLLRVSE